MISGSGPVSDSYIRTRLVSLIFKFAVFGVLLSMAEPIGLAAEEIETEGTENVIDSSETIISQKDNVNLVKDSSVAEAVKRRPDLNFANVTIDGENSGVSLSNLQTEDVTSVEVMKAVTPDLDANSRGGSISLRTRSTLDQKNSITAIEGAFYYDSIDGATGGRTKISYSGALNEARTWGARAFITYRASPYASNSLYQDWQTATVDDLDEFVIKDTGYGTFERDIEVTEYSLALDYKATEDMHFFWRNSMEIRDYDTTITVFKYRFFRGDYVSVNDRGGNLEGAEIRNSIWQYSSNSDDLESIIGGVYEANNFFIDFKYTCNYDDLEYLNYFTTDFVQEDVDLRYELDDPKFPTTTITNDKLLEDPEAYVFEDLGNRHLLDEESDAIGALNIKWDGLLSKQNAFIKAGFKTRTQERLRESGVDIYDDFNGSYTIADALSERTYPDILDGRYSLHTLPDASAAQDFFESNLDRFEFNERRSRENTDPNTYVANETVDALYGMINFEWVKWRAILGARHETTHVDFVGNEVILDVDENGEVVYKETNAVPGESKYDNFFPNVHFRYNWTETITVISSYTETIDRPSYTYLVPYRRVNLEGQEIEEGNPDLLPTAYTNFDLSFDLELPARALFSVEFFNRSVEDFIFNREQIIQSGIYQGFELDRYENSTTADIQGASLTWRQPIDNFLLPDGLSLNANYTKQKSEIEYPARPREILPLTHIPDNELKLTLSYQGEKLFAQVRYAYETAQPTRIARNADEDSYYLEKDKIELSLTYQLNKKIRLFADVQNLTNEPYYDRYEGDPSRPSGFRYFPWTMSSGARVEL